MFLTPLPQTEGNYRPWKLDHTAGPMQASHAPLTEPIDQYLACYSQDLLEITPISVPHPTFSRCTTTAGGSPTMHLSHTPPQTRPAVTALEVQFQLSCWAAGDSALLQIQPSPNLTSPISRQRCHSKRVQKSAGPFHTCFSATLIFMWVSKMVWWFKHGDSTLKQGSKTAQRQGISV